MQAKHAPFLSDVLTNLRMGINPGENRGATAGGNRGATAGGNRGAQGEPHPVGTFFRKEFHSGTFVGRVMKITKNYKGTKLYLVAYSDGDDEELTASQLKILRTAHGLVQLKDAASWKSDYDTANPIGFVAFSVNMHDIADLEDEQQAHSYFTSPQTGSATVEHVMLAKHKLDTIIALKQAMRKDYLSLHKAFNMTIEQALEAYPDEARGSIKVELESLFRKALRPVDWKHLSATHRRFLVPSKLFLKVKKDGAGNKTSLKARCVAGGHRQNREGLGDVSSPTVSLTAIMAMLAGQVFLEQEAITVDFPSAFLFSEQPEGDDPVFMALDKRTSAVAVDMHPELAEMLDDKGRLICHAHHGVYGLAKSSWLWHDLLTKTLRGMGYEHNIYDNCVMNKRVNGVLVSVLIYVDDCRFHSISRSLMLKDIDELQKIFGKDKPLTVKEGAKQLYLGMDLDTSVKGQMTITMDGYIKDLLTDMQITGEKSTPATERLHEIDETSPRLSEDQRGEFVTAVMRLYYLAKRLRCDTLTACAFLTRRSAIATVEDQEKLLHVLMYLNHTRDYALVLKPGSNLHINAYVDASFGSHFDKKSHTGCLIRLGDAGGAVYCRSAKQLTTSLSSFQSELIALSDSAKQVLWLRNFMIAQGFAEANEAATILQDNQSVVAAMSSRKSPSDKSRFILIRYFWLKEHLACNDVRLQYISTDKMLADMLTKPLTGETFRRFRDEVLQKKKEE